VSTGARRAPRARYLPIAEHGLIGDPHTAALVGTDGKIDWYCCPRFDSPSIFGAILDADHGGLFRISPDRDGWSSKQQPVATYGNRFCLFLRFAGRPKSSSMASESRSTPGVSTAGLGPCNQRRRSSAARGARDCALAQPAFDVRIARRLAFTTACAADEQVP
jgi:Domain of unknown function (DUF5911)